MATILSVTIWYTSILFLLSLKREFFRRPSHNRTEGDEKFGNQESWTATAQSFADAGEDAFTWPRPRGATSHNELLFVATLGVGD